MASASKAAIAVLRGARAVLTEHGWQQDGDFADDAGRLSLDGALTFAVTGRPSPPCEGSGIAEGLLLDALASRGYDGTVGDWNDEPGRTLGEVYALLDEVIDHRGPVRKAP